MNSDIIKGKWKQLGGRIKERWGNLSDDDLDVAEGHSEYLEGKLQTREWEKDGVKRYTTEVVVDSFNGKLVLIGGRPSDDGEPRQQAPRQQQTAPRTQQQAPRQQSPRQQAPQPEDDYSDDIPF